MRTLLTAALAGACVAGCAADARVPSPDPEPVPAAASKPAAVVVTRRDPSLPAACRPRAVALRIAAFFDAFNRGDPSAMRFFDPQLDWYSVTDGRPRRHFVTYSRPGLPEYFARRHRHGERLKLEQIDVSLANGLGHVAYRIDRRADDLRRLGITGTTAVGKGAVDCTTGRIVVWTMGMAPGRGYPGFEVCPGTEAPRGAIVACARR